MIQFGSDDVIPPNVRRRELIRSRFDLWRVLLESLPNSMRLEGGSFRAHVVIDDRSDDCW